MTGKYLDGKVVNKDSLYVHYEDARKNGKIKGRKLDLERVFSFSDSNGSEVLVYTMDTNLGNYFSVQEMRYYIKGEQDAMNNYKPHWVVLVGLPATAGVGFLLANTVTVAAFAVPFLYMIAANQPRPKIKLKNVSSPELVSKPAYVLGYERAVQNKRLFRALGTGLIGTAAAIIVGQSLML
jgi:hypothetical protein